MSVRWIAVTGRQLLYWNLMAHAAMPAFARAKFSCAKNLAEASTLVERLLPM